MSLLSLPERSACKQARFVPWGRGAGNGTLLPGGCWQRHLATRWALATVLGYPVHRNVVQQWSSRCLAPDLQLEHEPCFH